MPSFCGELRSSIFVCRQCTSDRTALVVALDKRASVVRDAISLGSPEASITAYTLNPATLVSSDENITQTLVQTLNQRLATSGPNRLDEVVVVPSVNAH